MDLVGHYIDYEGESYIVVAFDGTFYYLVSEETAKTREVNDEIFKLITQEEIEEELDSGR